MQFNPSKPADPAVEAELDRLGSMNISDLRKRYREAFRTEPPKAFGPDLLRRSIAYRIQETAYGGLPPTAKRMLDRLVKNYWKNPTGRLETPRRIKPDPCWSANGKARSTRSRWLLVASVTAGEPTAAFQKSQIRSPAPNGTGRAFSASGRLTVQTQTRLVHGKGPKHGWDNENATVIQHPALRDLCAQINRTRARARIQLADRPTRGLRGIYKDQAIPGLEALARDTMTMLAYSGGNLDRPALKQIL